LGDTIGGKESNKKKASTISQCHLLFGRGSSILLWTSPCFRLLSDYFSHKSWFCLRMFKNVNFNFPQNFTLQFSKKKNQLKISQKLKEIFFAVSVKASSNKLFNFDLSVKSLFNFFGTHGRVQEKVGHG